MLMAEAGFSPEGRSVLSPRARGLLEVAIARPSATICCLNRLIEAILTSVKERLTRKDSSRKNIRGEA